MDKVLLTALISSLTAIIVSLITAYLNIQQQKKSAVGLELLKFQIENDKRKSIEEKEKFNEAKQVLYKALEFTQKIKDAISILSNYSNTTSLSIDWLNKIKVLAEDYGNIFSEGFMKVSQEERKMLHNIKHSLFDLHRAVVNLVEQLEQGKQMGEKDIQSLENIRNLIIDNQQKMVLANLNIQLSLENLYSEKHTLD